MANFLPLKNYMFYCIDRLIDRYDLSSPFLDVGCGIGDVSQNVALKGWHGKAIDFSDIAIEKAKRNLTLFKDIEVEKKSLFQETGFFKTIFVMDVLEHIEDDNAALKKIVSLLSTNGHVIIAVPSNPIEWRWDDDVYGHYRRYASREISKKLIEAGLEPLVLWDFTYPIFWIMRRIYTRLRSSPEDIEKDKLVRTIESSSVNAWDSHFCSGFLSKRFIPWDLVYKMQFSYFKDKVQKGHEMLILAKKIKGESNG